MIGFLIFDSDLIKRDIAEFTIGKLVTFKIIKNYTSQDSEIMLFKNKYSNNYAIENEKSLLCASGTFIYKSDKGNSALSLVLKHMEDGKELDDIYQHFRGPYNLIYLNKVDSKIFLFTDKEGLQSSYCYSQNNKMAFSSNLLLLAALTDTTLDRLAIREFIHIGSCMQRKTFFNTIKKNEAGTKYSKINNKWIQERLWRLKVNYPYLPDSAEEIISKTSSKIREDLDVLDNIEGCIGSDLSGGTDTRTIVSFLLKYRDKLIVSSAGPDNHIDVIISKRIAQKMGLKHYWFRDVNDQDITHEKVAEAVEIANGNINPFHLLKSLSYFEEKARKFEIILGGNGGPLFKDHFWLFEFNRVDRQQEPNWQRIANLSLADYPLQDDIFIDKKNRFLRIIAKMFLNHSQQIIGTNNQKLDYVYFDLKCPSFMAPQFSLTNQFLDVYHPFMSGDLVEYMINIKPHVRKRNILQFSMVYNNNKKLAWIKTDNQCPAVPSVGKFAFLKVFVFWRYLRAFLRKFYMFVLKRNFVRPVHSLHSIANSLEKLGYFQLLNFDNMRTKALFSKKEIARIIENPDETSNFSYIMNILAIELFIKRVEELGNKVCKLERNG